MRKTVLRLLMLEERDVPSIVVETEPNDVPAAGNVIDVPGGDILSTATDDWLTVFGVVASKGDRDYYRITLTQPAGVFMNFNGAISTSIDAVLDVFAADGITLLGQSDAGYDFEDFQTPTTAVTSATSSDPSLFIDLSAG